MPLVNKGTALAWQSKAAKPFPPQETSLKWSERIQELNCVLPMTFCKQLRHICPLNKHWRSLRRVRPSVREIYLLCLLWGRWEIELAPKLHGAVSHLPFQGCGWNGMGGAAWKLGSWTLRQRLRQVNTGEVDRSWRGLTAQSLTISTDAEEIKICLRFQKNVEIVAAQYLNGWILTRCADDTLFGGVRQNKGRGRSRLTKLEKNY